MPTYTTRTALVKPSGSSSPAEPVDVTQLNANSDQIDRFLGCILVNDGVTPATGDLFDGAIVKERTSGIIWEARKNGGGTFDKVYISYPYSFEAYTASTSYGTSDTTYRNWGTDTYYAAGSKNASAGEIDATTKFWVCPVKGVYNISAHQQWASSGVGYRAGALIINTTLEAANTEMIVPGNTEATMKANLYQNFTRPFNVGDKVGIQVWQTSGGALNVYNNIFVTMLTPIQ